MNCLRARLTQPGQIDKSHSEAHTAFFSAKDSAHIVCSPLRRALQTACGLFIGNIWPRLLLEPAAREIKKNYWQKDCSSSKGNTGRRIAEIAKLAWEDRQRVAASKCREQWWNDYGESKDAIKKRVKEFLEQLQANMERSGDRSRIVVTHSYWIMELAHLLTQHCSRVFAKSDGDLPPVLSAAQERKLQNCGVLGFKFDASWKLEDACLLFDSQFVAE